MQTDAPSSAAAGLTEDQVRERVAAGQANDVPPRQSRTVKEIVRANVVTRFNALLGSMLVVILIVGPYQDALFGFVLVANTLIGIVQELRAKRTLDRLAVLTAPKARVVREGSTRDIPVPSVVLDDVLELQPGDQVVVDGVVVDAMGLEVDESLLSGESEPVLKHPGDEVLSGSFAAAGSGRYRATRVGKEAYAARLAEDAKRFKLTTSELRAGIDTILRIVTWVIVPTAILLVISQLRSNIGFVDAIRGSVAGTVAMVPEGLILLTSIAFAIGVTRLARRRVLVQELPAVEVLARVDVLCIDKTGTLTEGRLVVEDAVPVDAARPYDVALGALAASDPHPNATLLAIGQRFTETEGWRARAAVPFSSARKWSAASFGEQGTWVLGAPDVLIAGGADGSHADVVAKATELADAGRRVVLLSRTDGDLSGEGLPAGLEPVAIVVLGDRVREDAARTLEYFAQQGVEVKVLSGDHPQTVAAVAGHLGARGAGDPVDARELSEDPADLAAALEEHTIFGRVTPQQKRSMVKALQSRGHVVAMTGDGVNDVLALKDADLGIAMGSGAEASRSVAQLVLLDSTFDALPSVVGEGRRVLGNIERTSNLYVTKTVYAMLLAIGVGMFGLAFPFLPRHLTLIGALTIGIPSFFLALAPNQERARPGFLNRVLRFTIPAGTLAAVGTFLAYRLAVNEGVPLAQARTTATMVLCWIGFLILTIIAAPLTRARLLLIWSMVAAFVVVMLVPSLREFFALEPPPLIVWLAGFGIAALVWTLSRLFIPPDRPVGPGGPIAPGPPEP